MKAILKVIDDSGNEFQLEGDLRPIQSGGGVATAEGGAIPAVQAPVVQIQPLQQGPNLDFGLNSRVFIKKYGKGMSGEQIFALFVGLMTKGDPEEAIASADVEKLWGSMTSVVGLPFNRRVTTMAKERGWVDSKTRGLYSVTKIWKEIFNKLRLAE